MRGMTSTEVSLRNLVLHIPLLGVVFLWRLICLSPRVNQVLVMDVVVSSGSNAAISRMQLFVLLILKTPVLRRFKTRFVGSVKKKVLRLTSIVLKSPLTIFGGTQLRNSDYVGRLSPLPLKPFLKRIKMTKNLTKLECCVRTQTSRGQSAICGRTLRRMMNKKRRKMKKDDPSDFDLSLHVPTYFVINYLWKLWLICLASNLRGLISRLRSFLGGWMVCIPSTTCVLTRMVGFRKE